MNNSTFLNGSRSKSTARVFSGIIGLVLWKATSKFRRLCLVILVLTLAFQFGPAVQMVRAGTITVSSLADSGPGTLRQAILDAKDTTGADTILFSISGTIEILSTLIITDSDGLMIDGAGQSITISGGNKVQVMVVNSGSALTLQNLTIVDGEAGFLGEGGGIRNAGNLAVTGSTLSGNSAYYGGGIYNVGMLVVINSTFSGNMGWWYGGGIYIGYGSKTVTVLGSSFINNTGFISSGGGIFISYHGDSVKVMDSIFTENRGSGIAIDRRDNPVTVTDSTFTANEGSGGGGIATSHPMTITGSTFSDNIAYHEGGGIYAREPLTVISSTFSGNSAGGQGGGIFNTGRLVVTESNFSSNSANNQGGGIYNWGFLSVTNIIFSNNSADADGGGIYSYYVSLTVANSTFSANRAYSGGAIRNGVYSKLSVTSSTLLDNIATMDGGIQNDQRYPEVNSTVEESTFPATARAMAAASSTRVLWILLAAISTVTRHFTTTIR